MDQSGSSLLRAKMWHHIWQLYTELCSSEKKSYRLLEIKLWTEQARKTRFTTRKKLNTSTTAEVLLSFAKHWLQFCDDKSGFSSELKEVLMIGEWRFILECYRSLSSRLFRYLPVKISGFKRTRVHAILQSTEGCLGNFYCSQSLHHEILPNWRGIIGNTGKHFSLGNLMFTWVKMPRITTANAKDENATKVLATNLENVQDLRKTQRPWEQKHNIWRRRRHVMKILIERGSITCKEKANGRIEITMSFFTFGVCRLPFSRREDILLRSSIT